MGEEGELVSLLYFTCLNDCYCSMTLNHGTAGWSAVCDSGIS